MAEHSFGLNSATKASFWYQFKASVNSLSVSPGEPCHARSIQDHPQNHFLSHARVFIFADFWGITSLRQLSLQKLGQSLEGLQLTNSTMVEEVKEVAALLEYCYEARPKELMSMALLYAACKIDELWKSERFQEVLVRHGELARALLGAMIRGPNATW